MPHAFTPATERALQAAARFSPAEQLGLPEVLLGLLGETECLAAALLNQRQIDPAAVLARFPELAERTAVPIAAPVPSASLELAIAAVAGQCGDIPLPYELATEHLLLGVLLAGGEVAEWLAQAGLDAATLEQQVRSRYRKAAPAGHSFASEETLAASEAESLALPADPVQSIRPEPLTSRTGHSSEASASRRASTPSFAQDRHQLSAWRAVDASANRAREGLRVVEDYVRFALDDRHLTGELKRLRHDLAGVLATLPRDRLYAARDTAGDVGTQISTAAEFRREDLNSIFSANFVRAIEALRSLEEFGKLIAPGFAPQLEQLRYRAYTLQRAVGVTWSSLGRLAEARLYVLVDGGSSLDDCEGLARALISAGVHVLQLRDQRLDDRQLVGRARRLRQATTGTSTLLIINDRPDVAALVDADGVHLGQEDLIVRDARAIVGPDALIGVSTHSIEQARQAVLDGANYIGVGPTFPSRTKTFATFTGLDLLSAVAHEIRLPAFAIGGITLENLPGVQIAGFTRVAVSGAIAAAGDPGQAAHLLLRELGHKPIQDSNQR